jgi:hypothetical protein
MAEGHSTARDVAPTGFIEEVHVPPISAFVFVRDKLF